MNLGQFISLYCAENDITMAQFAQKADINRSYLFTIKSTKRRPGIETFRKAAIAMGMSLDDLLKQVDHGEMITTTKGSPNNEILLYDTLPLKDYSHIGSVGFIPDDGLYIAFKTSDLASIYGGDCILIVRITNSIENDSIVLCSYYDKPIIRRYSKLGKSINLAPLNPSDKTIMIHKASNDFILYGVVKEIRFIL